MRFYGNITVRGGEDMKVLVCGGGTADMVRQAKLAGIEVIEIEG